MFSLPGIVGLIVFLYLRPLDIFESLRGIPFLQAFLALALLGVMLDLRLGVLKLTRSTLTTMVAVWAGWTILVTLAHGMGVLTKSLPGLLTIMVLFFVVAHGVQSVKALWRVIGVLLACIAVLTAVGVHQSTRPKTCVALDARDPVEGKATPDGRACATSEECRIDPPMPDADYVCEKVGVFDIFSTGGRVRYTGTLRDPNELALTISLGLPVLYVFYERKKTFFRGLVAVLGAVGILYCVIQTASRGGILVVGAIMLVGAVRRFGWKGVVVAGVLASPLALFGGRGGEEASESSMERMEAAFVGIMLVRAYPLQGVGMGQFTEHNYLTAHNAYILTSSELGFPGGVIWVCLIYLCVKISLSAFVRYRDSPTGVTASQLGFVLLCSFAGLAVGIFFLSFAYHYVFWTYLGASAALYGAIRRHDPSFTVSLNWREVGAVAVGKAVMLTVWFFYVRSHV